MSAAKARHYDIERDALEPVALEPADHKQGERPPVENAARAALRAADPWAAPAASPALELQDQLHHAFAEAPVEARWSYRRTAAFLLVTCGGFWTGVAFLIHQLL